MSALDVMTSLACDYCGAAPGETCRTSGGRPCLPHAARFYSAHALGLLPLWDDR